MPEKQKNNVKNDSGFKFRYLFLIILVVLFMLAIFSHSAADIAVIEGGRDAAIKNWIGPVGAHTARLLFYLFGVAVYPILFFLAVCALRPLLPFPTERKGYVGALISLVLGITILFAMWPSEFAQRTAILGIGQAEAAKSALSGGVIGQQLAAPKSGDISPGIIRAYIGAVGTAIVAAVCFLTGAFFIFMADWKLVALELLKKRSDGSQKAKPKPEKKAAPVKETEEEELPEEKELKPIEELLQNDEPEPEPEPEEVPELPAAFGGTGGGTVSKSRVEPEPAPEPEPAAPAVTAETYKEPVKAKPQPAKPMFTGEYTLPLVTMLEKGKESKGESSEWIEEARQILQKTLESFNVDGTVTGIVTGPRVTRYELSLAPGVKVEKVSNIANNLAMELEAKSIRILAPIPGKNAVGVEVPNSVPSAVFLRSMMESSQWRGSGAEIPIILGKDVGGKPVILDLAKAPHLLIAGATGSGKSVCMNTLIMSLLFRFSPADLRLIMVDPKVVELEMYTPLPHLITPVVNDPHKVPLALRWAVNEMEKRYRIMAKVKTKNLAGFNSRTLPKEPQMDHVGNPIPDKMPILVIIVDELADVMMTEAKGDVETSIARIAQKGRAAGIHIVIATQRPSTNIITGVIKANLPTRIAFRVGSIVDSRVILDQKGAESLLGRGDMLFIPPGSAVLERIQGAMVDDPDIQKVVDFVSSQAEQQFDNKVVSDEEEEAEVTAGAAAPAVESAGVAEAKSSVDPEIQTMVDKYSEPGDDENIIKSLEILFLDRKISTSYIQRRLGIGYNKAAEIMDAFEARGIISPPAPGGSKRDILVFDEIENSK
jgi:S-DNA-T family DNA segregation ATPase FtsK/SpoIIIE